MSKSGLGNVTGVVRDAAGQVRAGWLVVPEALDGQSDALPELAVLSDSSGVYHWRLPPGRYSLVAQCGNVRGSAAEVVVASGRTATLDLRVP